VSSAYIPTKCTQEQQGKLLTAIQLCSRDESLVKHMNEKSRFSSVSAINIWRGKSHSCCYQTLADTVKLVKCFFPTTKHL